MTMIVPAKRVAAQEQDVWNIINEAAAASPIQPIVHMGQGFFGFNPPDFLLDAARASLGRVDCNQYSPSAGRPRLKKAIAKTYAPLLGKEIDPNKEVTITTGANEGMLSAFMAFVEPGDEVIVFEPFFDQYISNIQMAGGTIKYVPLSPPASGNKEKTSSGDWTIDMKALEGAFNSSTRMIVINSPHNPIGKVFSREELEAISALCVKHQVIILSDEVYDSLFYVPMTRIATLSPEVASLTLTVCSAGKTFYATGWRIGFLIGPEHLIKYVSAAHMRICYSSPSPLQEACAIAFEQAGDLGFWDQTKASLQDKIKRFTSVCDELDLPYSEPQGGYFVLVNFGKVKIPEDYKFPGHIAKRPRDFKLAWWLITEFGLAAIPPSEFYTSANQTVAEDYLRFAICKEDQVLEEAKAKLRLLKPFITI